METQNDIKDTTTSQEQENTLVLTDKINFVIKQSGLEFNFFVPRQATWGMVVDVSYMIMEEACRASKNAATQMKASLSNDIPESKESTI
jgi:hypothetical protein